MAFTRFTKNVLNVSALPDRVQNQAQALKATFDQAGVDIKAALNALIVELEASTSADNIGADVQSVATKTVQAILTAFEEAIDDRYTKTEAETLLSEGTNNLVADIDVNLTTGVITITKKDGTKVTFDTAIEKVPAKFEIVENGDTYALKITNVDGTTTQADITNFMNIYNFNNNDYITFEVTGEGTEKIVTANIKANSIGLDKLSLSVVSTLEGYMTSARDSATAAKTSETNARASELNALEAKSTAINKAAEATASANAAKTSEANAEYWAKKAETNGSGGGGITEIPVATTDTLGGIKVGEGLEITEDGMLSVLGNGSGYIEADLINGALEYNMATTSTSIGKDVTLNDNIENYDEIVFVVDEYRSDIKGYSWQTNIPVLTKEIVYNTTDSTGLAGDTIPLNIHWGATNVSSHSACVVHFKNGTTLRVRNTITNNNNCTKFRIKAIKGIKYNIKVLDGTIDIDEKPTEGSENVITSGGVYEAFDNLPYKVLEASADNVIDFNTLTEPGVYYIKNCTTTTAPNSYSSSSTAYDIRLIVTRGVNVSTGQLSHIYQYATFNHSVKQNICRSYTVSSSTWSEWDWKISASHITAGTFSAKVLANSTAVQTLTDNQVRNIKASTTDLTAGTSTLATGDIVLIYE